MGATFSRWRLEKRMERQRTNQMKLELRRLRRLRDQLVNEVEREHPTLSVEDLEAMHAMLAMREELERIRPNINPTISNHVSSAPLALPMSNNSGMREQQERAVSGIEAYERLRSLYAPSAQAQSQDDSEFHPQSVHTGDPDIDLVINQEIQNMSRRELVANFNAATLLNNADTASVSVESESTFNLDSNAVVPELDLLPNDNANVENSEVDQHVVNVDTNTMVSNLVDRANVEPERIGQENPSRDIVEHENIEPNNVENVPSVLNVKPEEPASQTPPKFCLICQDAPSPQNALITCWKCTACWCLKHYGKMTRQECPQCRVSLLTLSRSEGEDQRASLDIISSSNVGSGARSNNSNNSSNVSGNTNNSSDAQSPPYYSMIQQALGGRQHSIERSTGFTIIRGTRNGRNEEIIINNRTRGVQIRTRG